MDNPSTKSMILHGIKINKYTDYHAWGILRLMNHNEKNVIQSNDELGVSELVRGKRRKLIRFTNIYNFLFYRQIDGQSRVLFEMNERVANADNMMPLDSDDIVSYR